MKTLKEIKRVILFLFSIRPSLSKLVGAAFLFGVASVFGTTNWTENKLELQESSKENSVEAHDVFVELISPIMEKRCVSCHGEAKVRGKLRLDSYENILKGGYSGPAAVAKDLKASVMYQRIILPEDHDDFMPLGRDPLKKEQIEAIKWWVEAGIPKTLGDDNAAYQKVRNSLSANAKPASSSHATAHGGNDMVNVFSQVIQPIMEKRCVSCHGDAKVRGKLKLNSFENMVKGGYSGPAVVAGDLKASVLYQRIILPEDHDDFMPLGKAPLTKDQISAVKWWIEAGAPTTEINKSNAKNKEQLDQILKNLLGATSTGHASKEMIAGPDLLKSTDALQALLDQGFIINVLGEQTNLIEADLTLAKEKTTDFSNLSKLKDNLVWLQLSNTGVTDASLKQLSSLSKLRKLNLSKNQISSQGVKAIANLKNLEYLNLYQTNVTDDVIATLKGLPSLKKVYLWNTKITNQGIQSLKKAKPNLLVVYNQEKKLDIPDNYEPKPKKPKGK